ncbi:Retrovirus-related Pol polyprotein from transposon 297 [Araneus ventricosus]|uniref:Retrovirus-related Pol polyprotein from transposon 297 n=1 Tax=Araneus ventricosus TaxID=182803 RepID=A0A4Y2EGB5_ARAVE|nr:Retrovirus-related Pol polyprotein from transposon 297 [Araneus ventricosus]
MKKHVSAIVKKPFFKENVVFHPERKCKTSHPREVNQPRSNDFDKSVSSRPERKSSIRCYGCGYPGFIQSKCPKCTKPKEELKTVVQSIKLYAAESPDSPLSSICLTVCGRDAAFCADTGASNSIAGEEFFILLQDHKFRFYKRDITMVLADGKERNVEALTTTVNLNVEGKIVRVKFIALPEAKGNRILLGTDFLQAAEIVLNIQNGTWHFSENPHKQFSFYKNPSDVKENLPTISSHKVTSPETIPVASVPVILREDEGKHLTSKQRDKFNSLLKEFETCFHPGGDPTTFIEHRIQTGNNLPVSEPPYRMTPAKKELLKKELESLLAEGIIDECESPYASPVVLVPKPNGSIRLCIYYRKLNATTIPDTYPLPRMDDLLNEAKSTKFMSTIWTERVEQKQDQRKKYFDKNRRPIYYQPGDKVWVTLHPKSSRSDKRSKKFYPKRKGPYLVVTNRSPTTYDLSDPSTPDQVIGTYHTNMLKPYELPPEKNTNPVVPIKIRGVPPDRLDEIQPSCSANVGIDDKYKPTYSHKKSQQLKLSYGVSGCAAAAIASSVLQDTDRFSN